MSEPVSFIKMHGAGNDFVIIDSRIHDAQLSKAAIVNICHRHFGIGCDQLIELCSPKHKDADIYIKIYNSDASLSAACGNATRCVAALLMSEKEDDTCIIETDAGLLPCIVDDEGVINVDMGKPKFNWQDIPLAEELPTHELPLNIEGLSNPYVLSMGNPHCIFVVEDITKIDIEKIGSLVENHPFFPERCNVEFAQIFSKEHIRMRVWERGSGVTLACGSGTCATVVALAKKGLVKRKVKVSVDGGTLGVEWVREDDHVILSGPIAISFGGTLSESLWQER
ncbi:MAG: diaminopimelate epimerase [Alphaproteobacteria bacterium]